MAAAASQVSASVVDDCIACWRRARLSSDAGKLGYPRINILHAAYYPAGESDYEPHDDPAAETVQAIIDDMESGIRRVMEAFHLGLVNGDYCRHGHKARWTMMGLTKEVYEARERTGWAIIREALSEKSF